jgi:uncharacterized protein (TIGR02421 family)
MQSYSEKELALAIKSGNPFEGILIDGSLQVKILEWGPYLCTAIHAGSKLREDLSQNCSLSKEERRQEEDPYTDQLVEYCPITITGLDSRYEYDLNRPPAECIHEVAWEKQVWCTPLSKEQRQESQDKHAQFYRVLGVLIQEIIKRSGGCLVIDLHSYNWQIRSHSSAPVFNIGTSQLQTKKWRSLLETLQAGLSGISIPNLDTTVGQDVAFQGRGYQATFVRNKFPETPLIPLEIKKIFMDELSGEVFPLVIEALQAGLNSAVVSTATRYAHHLGRKKARKGDLASSLIEPTVLQIDREIYRLSKKIDVLHYVNPINYQQEKRLFFSRRDYTPSFQYRQLRIDPYSFREKLHALPVSQIQDPILRGLYRSVVDGYASRTDLITSIGTPQFLYNSLRHYGEPSRKDIANAHFLLHAPEMPNFEPEEASVGAEEVKQSFEKLISAYEIDFSVVLSKRMVAKAMVDPGRRVVSVNSNVKLTPTNLQALLSHEIGIHALTTVNADLQPLRIFGLGLPGNTQTQEGLAILSEYLSGNLPLSRLKQLALRVIAVEMLVEGASFRTVYHFLVDKHSLDKEDAFAMTTRVFRGGGFTKDFLYLSGFSQIVGLYEKRSVTPLMIGKTSLDFLNSIDNLIERGVLETPHYLPESLTHGLQKKDPILNYLIKSLV